MVEVNFDEIEIDFSYFDTLFQSHQDVNFQKPLMVCISVQKKAFAKFQIPKLNDLGNFLMS